MSRTIYSEYHLPCAMPRIHCGGVVQCVVDGQIRVRMGQSRLTGLWNKLGILIYWSTIQVVLIGGTFQTLSFSLNCWLPPYWLFVISMFLNGVGTSLQVSTEAFSRTIQMLILLAPPLALGRSSQ
jgi:hypothetical protein